MVRPSDVSASTWAVVGGRGPGAPGEPLNVPPFPASTFTLGGERGGYSRNDATPTWEALEELVGGLEGGHAVAFSSGMAVVAAVLDLLPARATILLPADCYHGVAALVAAGAARGRWSYERLAVTDTAAWLERAPGVDLVWLESPSNPLLEIGDLPAICGAARAPGALAVVDSTLATPLGQTPLALGADVVVHSATKYIGGHSDLLLGVAVAATEERRDELRARRSLAGATPGTLEAFLAVRGARTLPLRLRQASATAAMLAERLDAHPAVATVSYPGRADHPGRATAEAFMHGPGAMIAFDVRGGGEAADAVCRALRLVRHATSLGAVESTIERRSVYAGQEHLPPGLLRLSVGCEDADDVWDDLRAALGG